MDEETQCYTINIFYFLDTIVNEKQIWWLCWVNILTGIKIIYTYKHIILKEIKDSDSIVVWHVIKHVRNVVSEGEKTIIKWQFSSNNGGNFSCSSEYTVFWPSFPNYVPPFFGGGRVAIVLFVFAPCKGFFYEMFVSLNKYQ